MPDYSAEDELLEVPENLVKLCCLALVQQKYLNEEDMLAGSMGHFVLPGTQPSHVTWELASPTECIAGGVEIKRPMPWVEAKGSL